MTTNRLTTVVAIGALSLGSFVVHAQDKPDNTAVNKRDRNASAVTADQQTNTKSDLETTREIRRAIVADTSLSSYAHNVKIVTLHGRVTLKGPVKTDAERREIAAKATEIAGERNVVNRISIMSASPATKPAARKQKHS